jgi:hypothetical protein
MARAPQKVTRATEIHAGEPPARAARAPNSARNTSELHDTVHTSADNGTTRTSSNGNALIDFAAGTKEIFISPVAYNIVLKNNTGAITSGVVKTATLDFGNVPVNSSTLYITDSAATTASLITISPSASTANSAYGGDELEMDNFDCSAYCTTNGNITVQAISTPSPVWGKRNFNYIVGSGV